jgi:predicted DNA-binding transcriptional regulator AlpA
MLRSGKGRTALYGRIKAGTFLAPAKVGSSSRWFSTEVDEWVHAAMATRPAMTA